MRRCYCDLNIWPNDLERRVTVALTSGIIFTKFDLRQLKRTWIIAFLMLICYISLTLTLTRWPCNYKIWAKSNNPGWVIDDLARFRRAIFEAGSILRNGSRFSGVHGAWTPWTQLHQTWPMDLAIEEYIGQSSLRCKFVSEFRIPWITYCILKHSSKLSDVENDAKFRTFWPPVKISGWVGEIYGVWIN